MPTRAKDYRGFRVLGFRIVREKRFRKLVAVQCYGLTHELTTSKIYAAAQDGRFSGYTNNAWLELDRAMLEFTNSVEEGTLWVIKLISTARSRLIRR